MAIQDNNLPVSSRILDMIKAKGLKQNAFARQAGYSPQELNAMLNGRKIIKVSDVTRLSHALNVSPNQLFLLDTPPASGE